VQTLCLAQLALLDVEGGDWEHAARSLRRARSLQRSHTLEEYSNQGIVFAMSALVAAHAKDAASSRGEARHARRLLSLNRGFAAWLIAECGIVSRVPRFCSANRPPPAPC
jgi:hypothetical protein